MSDNDAKSLSQLLGEDSGVLGKLAGEAKRRASLSDYLRNELPDSLGDGLLHCNIEPRDTITLLAATPEWAARLRFATPEILSVAKLREPDLEQVRVKVGT